MNIENIQALIAQGLLTDTVSLDLTTTYVTVGVYQPGNRQNGPSGNAYPSYVLPLSQLAGSTYTASNGITLVGNDFQLASNLISQFTNDSGYLTSATTPITSADNGLNILSQVVELGGTLNKPTTIDAPGSNTLSFTDQVGLMFQTRDASGSFLMNNIGGTGTLAGSSGYIFSYLGDGGNVFTDSFIVINFGGANNLDTVTDFWNFGDYTQAITASGIFNIGRFNHFNNVSTTTVMGYSNTINSSSGLSVFGTGNTISGESDKFVLGSYDNNVVIDANTGNTGIGTFNPVYKLDIQNPTQASIRTKVTAPAAVNNTYFESNTGNVVVDLNAFVTGVGTSGGSRINFNHTGSIIGSIYTNTANNRFWFESSYDLQLYNSATLQSMYLGAGGIYFNTTSTNRMIVTDTGLVGIGIMSPTVALHVYTNSNSVSSILRNDQYAGFEVQASVIPAIYLSDHSGVSTMEMWGYHGVGGMLKVKDGFYWRNKSNNVEIAGVVNVDTNPNWAFGTHNGNAGQLADTRIRIIGQDSTSSNFALKVTDVLNTKQTFAIRNDGNVGIGTYSPSARLQVVGASDTLADYAIITTNNSGSAGLWNVRNDGYLFSTNSHSPGVSSFQLYNTNTGIGFDFKGYYGRLALGVTNTVVNATLSLTDYGTVQNFINFDADGNKGAIFGLGGGITFIGKHNTASRFIISSDDGWLGNNGYRTWFKGNAVISTSPFSTSAQLQIQGTTNDNTLSALLVDNSGTVTGALLKVRNDGVVSMSLLPTSNAGLSTGDMYVDTAANILANGDKVVGWKV